VFPREKVCGSTPSLPFTRMGGHEIRTYVRLAKNPVGERTHLGAEQSAGGNLKVTGIQRILVIRDATH